MIEILCRVGIHRAVWVPALTPGMAWPGLGNDWAPPIRKCRDCPATLERRHK